MALGIFDRVRETTTVTGTGAATLLGAVTGYQSFAVVGNANTTYYCIAGQGTSEWEVGIGTYTASGTTLARTTVISSSNANALVSFSAGSKDVFVTYPSTKAVYLDASGNVTALGVVASGTWQASTIAIAYGGTNSSATPTAGGVNYGTGTAHGFTAAGTSGQILTSAGASAPTWAANPPAFPSGTLMMFVQTSAPTGWTKSITHDNKALRIVSGTASSGGSVAFTTAFASQSVSGAVAATATQTATNQATTASGSISVTVSAGTLAVGAGTLAVGATTLATTQIPSHTHTQGFIRDGNAGSSGYFATTCSVAIDTGAAGGGGSHTHGLTGAPSISGSPAVTGQTFTGTSHNHTQDVHSHTSGAFTGTAINLAVAYVDVIIASKD